MDCNIGKPELLICPPQTKNSTCSFGNILTADKFRLQPSPIKKVIIDEIKSQCNY